MTHGNGLNKRRGAIGLSLVVLLAAGHGCGLGDRAVSGPALHVHAVDGYSATMRVLATARRAGDLSEDEVRRINRLEPMVWAALREWRLRLRLGRPTENAKKRFEDRLNELRGVADLPPVRAGSPRNREERDDESNDRAGDGDRAGDAHEPGAGARRRGVPGTDR